VIVELRSGNVAVPLGISSPTGALVSVPVGEFGGRRWVAWSVTLRNVLLVPLGTCVFLVREVPFVNAGIFQQYQLAFGAQDTISRVSGVALLDLVPGGAIQLHGRMLNAESVQVEPAGFSVVLL